MGAAASALPAQIDLATFRRMSGGNNNDPLFETYSQNGILSRERLIEIAHGYDCSLSLDRAGSPDSVQRAQGLLHALRSSGDLSFAFDQPFNPAQIGIHIQTCVEKSRSVLILATKSYIDKVNANAKNEICAFEFNCILRKRGVDNCVVAIMDATSRDRSQWGPIFGIFSQHKAVVDLSGDGNLGARVGELAGIIGRIARPETIVLSGRETQTASANTASTTNTSQTPSASPSSSAFPSTREQAQFCEWLARSTRIPDGRRAAYCAVLLRSGIQSARDLAQHMASNQNFLLKLGFEGPDVDQIVQAVADLGLGDNTVRDFSEGSSTETAMYALNKAFQNTSDKQVAASAFACVARIASISPAMAQLLCDAGVVGASVRLLQSHISCGPVVSEAFKAIKSLAINEGNVGVLINSGACNIIPQCMGSHPDSPEVQSNGASSISSISCNPSARSKFGQAGACEAIIKALNKHANNPMVVETACTALNQLCLNCIENNAKFGNFGAPNALTVSISANVGSSGVLRSAFQSIQIIGNVAENRASMGENGIAKSITAGLVACGEDPLVVEQGCQAIITLLIGSAINRTRFGQAGACQVIAQLLQRHAGDHTAARALCAAMFALASGNSDNQKKLYPSKPLLASLANNRSLPEALRTAAREADLSIKIA